MSETKISSDTTTQHTQRTKTGCQNCRLRHLKCDEQRPSCVRCEKSGIECVRGYNIRFRHGANPSVANLAGSGLAKTEYDFSKKQTWVKTARSLTFLDETPELINIYDHVPDENNPHPTPFTWPDPAAQKPPPPPPPPAVHQERSHLAQEKSAQSGDSPAVASGPSTSHSEDRPEPPQYPWPDGTGLTPQQSTGLTPTPLSDKPPFASPGAESQTYSERHLSTDGPDSGSKRRRLTHDTAYPSSTASGSPGYFNHRSPGEILNHRSPAGSWHTGWTPTGGIDHVTCNPELDLSSFPGLETSVSQSLSRIYLDSALWPLHDREQAKLLRYYVETLSRNFDLTDPLNHFRSVVPQRAAVCPTLMNAILALSARHLSRIGEYDPLVSNKYHQECLKHLIPMLDDTAAILDENLLASTIILRHLEELEVPISGQPPADQHSHLLGAQAFIQAQERAAVTGGLRQAAFWVGLRQEVYVAFVNQRPVLPALEHCNVDRSFEAADDHIWACRMVVLCADTLRFCFSDGHHSVADYKYIEEQVQQWWSSKPSSFVPVYYREPEGEEAFPEIWYVADEHATGIQHFHLARILLASHNPSTPRLGPGRASALKTMDNEIRKHVRILCGMALSNPNNAPAFTYGAMACTMAGDKFDSITDQRALLDVLDRCDRDHAWPTGVAITNLKAAWGWSEQENYIL